MFVKMTSNSRRNTSGISQRAHSVPPMVTPAVTRKMLLVEKPTLASEPPASDPNRIPVKTQVLENEMTAPRRSGGDLHWRMAFSGTKMKEQETPRNPNTRNVPNNGGVSAPSKDSAMDAPVAPTGINPYSIRL